MTTKPQISKGLATGTEPSKTPVYKNPSSSDKQTPRISTPVNKQSSQGYSGKAVDHDFRDSAGTSRVSVQKQAFPGFTWTPIFEPISQGSAHKQEPHSSIGTSRKRQGSQGTSGPSRKAIHRKASRGCSGTPRKPAHKRFSQRSVISKCSAKIYFHRKASQGSSGTPRKPIHKKFSQGFAKKLVHRKASQGSAETPRKPFHKSFTQGSATSQNSARITVTPVHKQESQGLSETFTNSPVNEMRKGELHHYRNLYNNKNTYSVQQPRLDTHSMKLGCSVSNDS